MSTVSVVETWRPVVEKPYGDYYDVSDLGNVRSWNNSGHGRRAIPRALKLGHWGGRPNVVLYTGDGRRATFQVSALVAGAFIGPRPPGMCVCHADDVPRHNWVDNLRYDTRVGNEADKVKNGRHNRGTRNGQAKLTEKDVHKIRKLLAEGVTQRKIGAKFHVDQVLISLISRGKLWKHLPHKPLNGKACA